MVFSAEGSLMVFNEEQPAKALSPRVVTLEWIVTLERDVQAPKVPFGISFMAVGIVKLSKEVHCAKMLVPKFLTEVGIFTLFRFGRLAKEAYSMDVTVFGTSTVTMALRFFHRLLDGLDT